MKDQHLLKHIKDYWIIYAFLVQLVISYTVINQSITDNTRDIQSVVFRVERIEENEDGNALIIAQINSRLASIDTAILFIKEKVR